MKVWRYNLGNWIDEELFPSGHIPWGNDEEQEQYLSKNGYKSYVSFRIGDSYRWCNFHEHEIEKKWFVDISFSEDCNEVIIENTPSMIMFLKEFGHIFEQKHKNCDFVKMDNDNYLRKDSIFEIVKYFHGLEKDEKEKDRKITLYALNEEGEREKILESHRGYVDDFLKENFGIE